MSEEKKEPSNNQMMQTILQRVEESNSQVLAKLEEGNSKMLTKL